MTHQELWAAYRAVSPDAGEEYEAWAYGDDPDTLAELTRKGIKTATASAGPLYELEGEPLPQAGEYSVILDSRDEAVCVIRTTRVYSTPFCEVTAEHARKEGEGNRTRPFSAPSWPGPAWNSPRICPWCVRSSRWPTRPAGADQERSAASRTKISFWFFFKEKERP